MPSMNAIRLRAAPHVDLRRLDELPADQRAAFRDLEGDRDFYGLLIPRSPLTINIKAVQRRTAELFATLRQPALLDEESRHDAELVEEIRDLVLDGILEVESAGTFVSGADAHPLVCEPRANESRSSRA